MRHYFLVMPFLPFGEPFKIIPRNPLPPIKVMILATESLEGVKEYTVAPKRIKIRHNVY